MDEKGYELCVYMCTHVCVHVCVCLFTLCLEYAMGYVNGGLVCLCQRGL